eukprot:40664_1
MLCHKIQINTLSNTLFIDGIIIKCLLSSHIIICHQKIIIMNTMHYYLVLTIFIFALILSTGGLGGEAQAKRGILSLTYPIEHQQNIQPIPILHTYQIILSYNVIIITLHNLVSKY